MMFASQKRFSLGRPLGFPVSIDVTAIVLFAVLLLLTNGSGPWALLGGLLFIILAVLSIIAHELGHAVAVRELGYGSSTIVLSGMGGVTLWHGHPTHRDRIKVALAGPAVTAALAIIGFILHRAIPLPDSNWGMLLSNALQSFAWINVFWVVFNLLPIHPMDGGVVVRSWLSMRMPTQQAVLRSLKISFVVGGLVIVAAVVAGWVFAALIMGFILLQNWQEWQRADPSRSNRR